MKDPEDNDCLRCCVAYFLGRDPATVPNFVVRYPKTWVKQMRDWLRRETGIYLVAQKYSPRRPGSWTGEAPAIAACKHRKGYHAVICGTRGIIYDPCNPPYRHKKLRIVTRFWFTFPPLPYGALKPRKTKT